MMLFMLPLVFFVFSCSQEIGKEVTILSYNLYLMFDDRLDGDEYPPFDNESYRKKDYARRIGLYAKALRSEMAADIMIFQEIESKKVLEDLINAGGLGKETLYYGFLEENNPISVGYISRYPIKYTAIHKTSSPRSILELGFDIGGEDLVIFCIHAKSNVGGGDEERGLLFEELSYLLEEKGDGLCLAVGDFNEDPLLGTSFTDERRGLDSALVVTGDRNRVDMDRPYCLSLDASLDCSGSYYYEDGFVSLDNMLFNYFAFDGMSLDFKTATLVSPLGGQDYLFRPKRYDMETGEGYSDHFALIARLGYN